MPALIYFVCIFVASVIQVLLRGMLGNGTIPVIPSTAVIYGVALWIANRWSKAYKEK